MSTKNTPTITVVIATYNSENTIKKCLQSVRNQVYPQNKIDIIIGDGESQDKTREIVKEFDVKIISIAKEKQNAEYNKGVAVGKARGEVLLFIDHDNVLPHAHWLSNMIAPLLEDNEIIAVETLRYAYRPKASLLDRYLGLYGAGDPLAFYLGKADRLSFIYDSYNLFGKAIDKGDYYKVTFKPSEIPTLGANGFLIRREILMKYAMTDEDNFFHIDVNVDLIRKGFNIYAFIKDDIIHLTGYKNISHFLYRRKLFMEQFHINTHKNRRYSVYMPQDTFKLIFFVIYAVTFIKPTVDALRGFIKIRDIAWFLHPLLCFCLVIIYGSVMLEIYARRVLQR